MPTITYPPDLPVSARREDLLDAIGAHQVVVVAGETGSGKTTQLPKLCLELGRERIAHTQPRRLAARSVAARIAEELGVELGTDVGYAVRFDDRSAGDTRIKVCTDGLLLAEIRRDRELRRYDTIIVDEAHERSLNVDFLLAYLARLLPRRPDLKLVITSATIDPQRFAAHFGGAPVVEVSGRTYPVETRYRPPAPETDQPDAIGDAIEELLAEPPGDILVFLSGEREIRDTAEALAARFGDAFDLLPLYARLSAGEQQRVFKPHRGRRVVLATNVAETSLTVPGIRYVVDPGFARISRYSARLKVQRLPIEPVSQASADQRQGRCGRVADGVCVRLFDEEDFLARPRFTDPEVLRTNLASVLLQAETLGLGPLEELPFLDPPDARQIRDGRNLLHELGAMDARGRVTKLGRRLARIPLDPRLGRMVLEADRLHCAEEVCVIAAALSIQDPRERPADKREAADERHARFADPDSDFLSYLRLWEHLHEQRRELSGSAFRRMCRDEFLHYLRVREWQDLVGQIRRAARESRVRFNRTPAEPEAVHRAVLAGLLSHAGLRDAARRDYLGARGSRFVLWPGSALAKGPPAWVMVAELVETSRLFGRTAARIDPRWLEEAGEHLVKRTYSEPRWSRKRASAVATERVTLYGLPVVTGRTVAYGAIDPELSRELFLREALVHGEWDARHAFLSANREAVEEVRALEERLRRHDVLADESDLVAFFAARVPPEIVSGAAFDRWWRDGRREQPDLLTYPPELLRRGEPDAAGRPGAWRQGDLRLRLSYRFAPGEPDDGATVHVPLAQLAAVHDVGFDWLVPALREELVTALIRGLPKDVRKHLVPAPDVAAEVLSVLEARRAPLREALSAGVERVRGLRVDPAAWDVAALAPHLRMHFAVEDAGGAVVAFGDSLDELRREVRPLLQEQLTAAAPDLVRSGARTWVFGTVPRQVAGPGFPALVDEGDGVGLRIFDTPAAQAAAMSAGTRRLVLLTSPSPLRAVRDRLDLRAQVALAELGVDAVLGDALEAAADALVARAGGPAWDEAGFARLRGAVAGDLHDEIERVVAEVVEVLDAARDVRERAASLAAAPFAEARRDVLLQVARLVAPGFVRTTGVERLPDLRRYLAGAARRLERLPAAPAADAERMAEIRQLESEAAGGPPEVRWLLEELRVSLFAQTLGTRVPVSAKRIRRVLSGR